MADRSFYTLTPIPRRLAAEGRLALAAAGALFVCYPAVRPYFDESSAAGAAAFASSWWIVAHLAAVAGFVLLACGLLALRDALAPTPGGRLARLALSGWWVGTGLVLPYYGAETFALHAIGQRVGRSADLGLLDLVGAVRTGPVQLTTFGLGLLVLAAAAVLAAVAVGRSGVLPPWSGALLAAGFVLYLPQFYAPPYLRIAHGMLVGAGCLVLAAHWAWAGRTIHRHARYDSGTVTTVSLRRASMVALPSLRLAVTR